MWRAAWIDGRAGAIGQSLIKRKPGQVIAQANQRCGQNTACRAVKRETMPLRKDTGQQQDDQRGMKDKSGKGSPGIFVGIEIGNLLLLLLRTAPVSNLDRFDHATHSEATFA